mmetsp:Transcript_5248/g.9029  ORF Transcript_5248/g.9029 Transcript_5248/m.9029 type:complete len:83 (-) Transcript_5248:83-331(-)
MARTRHGTCGTLPASFARSFETNKDVLLTKCRGRSFDQLTSSTEVKRWSARASQEYSFCIAAIRPLIVRISNDFIRFHFAID